MSLMHFYGQECPHCETMAPLVEKLKAEGFKIESYETWHSDENAKLYEKHDKGCGGVPYFVNTKSHKWICGEASFEDLKRWAEGK